MSTVSRTINIDGNKVNVTLAVEITEGETYYLIDEKYPVDFDYIESSNGGFNLEGSNTIKWVVIAGAQDMEYTYTIEIPEGVDVTNTFNGTYMFEGDVTEKTILGKATVSVENNVVGIHEAKEAGVRKALRDSGLANRDAQEKVDDFEICVEIVAENSTQAADDSFRFDEHNGDWAQHEATEYCDYMMHTSVRSQATVDEYLTLDVPTKDMFANQMRKNGAEAVKINIRLQKLIAEYNSLYWIAIRAVKMEINRHLQAEEEARNFFDIEGEIKATTAKKAAQKKAVDMHIAHQAKYGIEDPVVGFGGAAELRAEQKAMKEAHVAEMAALREQVTIAEEKAAVAEEQVAKYVADEIIGVIYDKDGMHELRADGEAGELIIAQKDYVFITSQIVSLADKIRAQSNGGI